MRTIQNFESFINESVTLKYLKGVCDEKTLKKINEHPKKKELMKAIDKVLKEGEMSDNNMEGVLKAALKIVN